MYVHLTRKSRSTARAAASHQAGWSLLTSPPEAVADCLNLRDRRLGWDFPPMLRKQHPDRQGAHAKPRLPARPDRVHPALAPADHLVLDAREIYGRWRPSWARLTVSVILEDKRPQKHLARSLGVDFPAETRASAFLASSAADAFARRPPGCRLCRLLCFVSAKKRGSWHAHPLKHRRHTHPKASQSDPCASMTSPCNCKCGRRW